VETVPGDEIFDLIKESGGIFELYRVTAFEGYRKRRDGEVKSVRVEILDAGPGVPERWTVSATDADGRRAGGNPAERLDVALAITHWPELDREEPPPS